MLNSFLENAESKPDSQSTYKVCVLMSTYNGEKFLEEQLESIFNQKGVEILLLVRDDVSTDKTVEILRKFRNKYLGQIVIFEGKNNIGWRASFLTLLYKAKEYSCPYYAFSDQDDVWLENKLYSACKCISECKNTGGGVLHYSNQTVIDSNGKRLFEVREYKDWFEKNISKKMVLLDGGSLTIGCTMIFNRTLLMKATQGSLEVLIDGQMSHDYWLGVVATYFGNVVYTDETYILHRRHSNSVTNSGKKRKRSFLKRYRNNAKTIYKFYKDGSSLLENDRDYIMLVAKKKNLFEKLRLMSDKEFCYTSKLSTLKLRLQIFLGIF